MAISDLLESISQLWPFSQILEMNEDGFFVNPQTSHGGSIDEINEGMAHGTAIVSLATPEVYVSVPYLTVSFSHLRFNHSY